MGGIILLLLLVLSQNDVLGTSGERGTKGSPREGWEWDRRGTGVGAGRGMRGKQEDCDGKCGMWGTGTREGRGQGRGQDEGNRREMTKE